MSALRTALAAMAPPASRVALAVMAGVLALGSGVALTVTAAWLISRAAEHPPLIALSVAIVAVRALGIARGVFRYLERLASHDVALRGAVRLRAQLYRRVSEADRSLVVGLRRGELMSRIGPDVDVLSDVLVRGLQPFAVGIGVGAASCVLVAALDPVAGLLLAGCLAVGVVGAALLGGVAAARSQRVVEESADELAAQAHDLLDHCAELTVSGQADHRLSRADAVDAARSAALDAATRPGAWAVAVSTSATAVAMVAALVAGSVAVQAGRMSPVLLAVVTLVPLALADAISPLPTAAGAVGRGVLAAGRLQPLLEAAPARRVPASLSAQPDSRAPLLEARALACGWPGRPEAMGGLDLTVHPGELLAVTGPSGSGKTSLLLTLAGLLAPVAGSVRAQGVDTTDWSAQQLRRAVTYTAEDAHVFSTTLRDNLLVARGDAEDRELRHALDVVGLGGWLAGLASGLDAAVSPREMSGGERRRLLVARALLVGSDVLLLDEPTEHLDPTSAQDLLLALREHARTVGVAVVVATHYEAVGTLADRVLEVSAPGGSRPRPQAPAHR
ncbi:thiol reductant ABC exporter subunit CydC [Angustibacter sp. McL0619]|uniref:thiol reductant ABC exporter subunit CydC n=1 Tax=Angustibacter sp. McL0619 TaxID=3415676 RepID=UPI003CEAC575